MGLRLPPGYYLELDADTAVLRKEKGQSVAVFSVRGAVWETIERVAWEDHRAGRAAGASPRRPESGGQQHLASTLGRPPSPPRPRG